MKTISDDVGVGIEQISGCNNLVKSAASTGLSSGGVAGIVIVVLILLILVVFVVAFLMKR